MAAAAAEDTGAGAGTGPARSGSSAGGAVGGGKSLSYSLAPTPAELEFLAEQEPITITPSFASGPFQFIEGEVGPFAPNRNLKVPLWLALVLKKRARCRIHPPDWLNLDWLKEKLEEERGSQAFAEVPEHFLEVSALLLETAEEDIESSEEVRRLLQDMTDIRQSKTRQGLENIKSALVVNVRNLTPMEINSVRPFFAASMDTFFRIHQFSNQQAE